MSIPTKLSGVALGAGLMYFLDPLRGRKRRARLVDATVHARRVERELVAKAVRDAQHRVQGLSRRAQHATAEEISDPVLDGRVRAHLGRVVTHPRAVEVTVQDGCVVLRGAILAREADTALAGIARIGGVEQVIDELIRAATPEAHPLLHGEGRVIGHRGSSWPPALQVGAIGGGALLAIYGLVVRRGLLGIALGTAGGALATRGVLNRPLRDRVAVHKTITVHAPIERVRELWSRLDELPRFMEHVHTVEVAGKRSRWTVDSLPGTTVTFEAELDRSHPDVLAWRTLPGQPIQHEGRVQFESAGDATRVHVALTYRPPGGIVGHAIARLFGFDPRHRMDGDLVRMKALLEDGHTRAHHQRFDLSKVH